MILKGNLISNLYEGCLNCSKGSQKLGEVIFFHLGNSLPEIKTASDKNSGYYGTSHGTGNTLTGIDASLGILEK